MSDIIQTYENLKQETKIINQDLPKKRKFKFADQIQINELSKILNELRNQTAE